MESSYSELPPTFSLREIASWRPGVCPEVKTNIRASIPALQRGLVWTPQQNELLWDSILRGFPIGSIVVTKWSDKLKKTAEAADISITYHLLDGQQRCHAISLGFSDPFVANETIDRDRVGSILWLDLQPTREPNSTRNFWVRATTTAHPWGYRKDDAATPLFAGTIRNFLLAQGFDPSKPDYRRPSPLNLWPCEMAARTPVPLSWLLRLPVQEESVFWSELERMSSEATRFKWAAKVYEFCVSSEFVEGKSRIFNAIKKAHAAKLIALEAPEELLEGSEQEKCNSSNREDVSNIEQLFQRLNRQGTKLDGEELAFSMIKAYWPDLEQPINKASKHRMPQARMVSLGVRAALARDSKQNLPGPPTVSALRVIAQRENDKKDIIQTFITNDLGNACDLVGQWLKYDPQTNPSGLLPVHITSIAINSRDVYLLLVHFAKRILEGAAIPKGWPRAMQALATVIHWFAPEKAKVANRVYISCRDDISIDTISKALVAAHTAGEIYMIHAPGAIETFVQLPETGLKDWNWWNPIHGDGTIEGIQQRRVVWEGFLNFRKNRELLLYAQRGFLARRFRDYDPARKDLWEAHNRPWDFDHIFASYYFYNRKDGSVFRNICGEWGTTIGNLRAWPFEDNRSDQADKAEQKVGGNASLREDSFLTADEEKAFSGGDKTRTDEATARLFATKCRERLLRIYQSWYNSVGIAELVPPVKVTTLVSAESATMRLLAE